MRNWNFSISWSRLSVCIFSEPLIVGAITLIKNKNSKRFILLEKNTGKTVAARSGKIIAGLEVNKTLELLLIIAKAIESKVSFLKRS